MSDDPVLSKHNLALMIQIQLITVWVANSEKKPQRTFSTRQHKSSSFDSSLLLSSARHGVSSQFPIFIAMQRLWFWSSLLDCILIPGFSVFTLQICGVNFTNCTFLCVVVCFDESTWFLLCRLQFAHLMLTHEMRDIAQVVPGLINARANNLLR